VDDFHERKSSTKPKTLPPLSEGWGTRAELNTRRQAIWILIGLLPNKEDNGVVTNMLFSAFVGRPAKL